MKSFETASERIDVATQLRTLARTAGRADHKLQFGCERKGNQRIYTVVITEPEKAVASAEDAAEDKKATYTAKAVEAAAVDALKADRLQAEAEAAATAKVADKPAPAAKTSPAAKSTTAAAAKPKA